jgi:hypothetical protein
MKRMQDRRDAIASGKKMVEGASVDHTAKMMPAKNFGACTKGQWLAAVYSEIETSFKSAKAAGYIEDNASWGWKTNYDATNNGIVISPQYDLDCLKGVSVYTKYGTQLPTM